ncbi:MAG: CHAT domain-containing protein, partial [Blastocatellia bacterium]|nr:CHAT domain-containing protein [Blastocatellia bacterium]
MKKYAQSICTRKMVLVTAGLTMALLVSHARAQDITPLEPGKPITRTAKARDAHNYSLPLTAGQFIRALVEQDTVDVSVDLIAPDNKPVHLVNNSRFWGTESLSCEAATSGTYKLVVRALSSPQSEGSYQIQLGIKDTATAQDRQRIAAEQAMSEITRTGPRALPPEQKAEKHKDALRLWQALGDKQQEANAHEVMGMSYGSERKYELARESFKQALALRAESQDQLGSILTLSNLGIQARLERNNLGLGNNERGQQLLKLDEDFHQQALTLSRTIKNRGAERFILMNLAFAYRFQSLPEKVIATWEQVLAIDRESKNRADEASTLRNLGQDSSQAKRDEDAQRYFEESLTIFRELKDRAGEASAFYSIGLANQTARRNETALQNYTAALVIYRELKDRRSEANVLRSLGFLHERSTRHEEAAQSLDEALAVFRELKDRTSVMGLLGPAALARGRLKQYEKAQEYYDELLAVHREAKDRKGEAGELSRIGYANYLWSRYEKALEYYDLALPISKEVNDRPGLASLYREYGNTYGAMGRYDKSIEYFELSLPIWRELNNKLQQASLLNNLGFDYGNLNRSEKAIEYLEQALALYQQVKSPLFESGSLDNMAMAYLNLGEYAKALTYSEQAIKIVREVKSASNEGFFLNTLGLIFHKQGQYEKAIETYELAISRLQSSKNYLSEEANMRARLAGTLRAIGQIDKAIEQDLHALQIARTTKTRDYESFALNGLMQDWKARNQPQLAILFGKQSVNVSQEMRSNFSGLDQQTQRSFLQSKESTYRELADILISQGRLPEAEQVIRMLKEEEYFEYVRRDQNNSPKGEKAALTPEEAAIEKRYREIADQLTILGTERGDLLGKPSRTTQEEQRLAKLEADLTVANKAFQTFLEGLSAEFAKKTDGQTRVIQVREAQGLMEDLRELGKGTVALYTLVGENKFRVILTTPDVQKAYEVAIKGADLNRKVLALREALQNPRLDPRPAAQELYQILFAPLAKDLEQMKAKTLMWSLDGVLRYVPVAALYDGKQYLVERFQHTIFTPVSKARLKDEPSRNWKALGLGVTKSFGPNIPALPAVADEMRGIIKDETNGNGGKGILPGTIKLDDQFTFESMKTGLRQRPPVVHVASHFRFKPGDETDSALLLGDGQFLSLAQIKDLPSPFGGVELLTLSACNTATGGSNANGKEVEGFGVLAQDKGAKAVVARLWPVADRTT